ncbi:MAG: glutaredoxin family protein [Candidatus Sungbacteria bacterium]|uniref:Glutaredoxin family protein n=1 Tax=Candidatus Sungiibacteriota bacterium TaxID=2750080 RepID=A0A932VR45_9BACT|nr:glutaredoxin family protein [Candidatus Sungbacteria bacterium]
METEQKISSSGASPAARVVIYSTPYCVYCKMAKEFFKKNNVAYQEKDVASDLAAQQEMIAASGQMGVPVIRIGDKIIIGFDQARLKEALGLA